jgi:hypothetical protein
MTTHLLNLPGFEKNRARDRTSNRSSFVLIGSQLEQEYASPSHRSRLPHVPAIVQVEQERRGISIAAGGNPKMLGPRYGPASRPIATSPTAVDAALRDTSRPALWRDSAPQRHNISPKARQVRRVDPSGPFSEVDFTRPRRPEDNVNFTANNNSISISSLGASTGSLERSSGSSGSSGSSVSIPGGDSGDPMLLSSRRVKSVDIWPRKKQYVTVETAEQERQARMTARKTFTGTLTREVLTGGYNDPSAERSRLQEDFDWPCVKAYRKVFLRGGGLEHTEGHGHALACEHMKGFRGGESSFEHMANGGGIGHDHGATRKTHIQNFGK